MTENITNNSKILIKIVAMVTDAMAIKYFDTLEYVKESEKRGANRNSRKIREE